MDQKAHQHYTIQMKCPAIAMVFIFLFFLSCFNSICHYCYSLHVLSVDFSKDFSFDSIELIGDSAMNRGRYAYDHSYFLTPTHPHTYSSDYMVAQIFPTNELCRLIDKNLHINIVVHGEW